MVTRVGTIGFSEGNGHPFSFSAIINGYDDEAFAQCGWPVIHRYLQAQPPENFGFEGFRVTAAWMPDRRMTERLCRACRIDHALDTAEDMIEQVDAVLVARDDWRSHAPLALPLLEAGKWVLVDKPLSLDAGELDRFQPYLESGRLMSTAGLRFARELDPLRGGGIAARLGRLRLIQGAVLNGLEAYGIHLIEAVAGLEQGLNRPRAVTRLRADHPAYALEFDDGTLFALHCLGAVGKTFHLSFFGERQHLHFDLHDNFSAFRRMLEAFFGMVRRGTGAIPAAETRRVLELICQARRLAPGQRTDVGSEASARAA